ncbi:MAG: hypothetical protein SGCHY_003118, partial [Lobulomycetales sp.]
MCAGFISHPSPAFQASTRLESKVIQESGHKPFSLAYFNVANPSWLSGDRGGDALLGTFPIQHHLSPPGEPIESLHGKVLEALEMSDDEFLYLSSSERVLRLLARLEKGTSTGVLSPSERELVDYFKRAIGPLPESVKFASGDSVAYFKSRSQEDSRSAFHSSLEQRQVPSFHVDGNAGADFHVNIWIATTDVAGYPLAFARSDPRMTFSGCLPVDPKWQYHFVPDMKAGEMLIFKALAQCGTPNGWTTVDSTAALRDLASCTTLRGSLRVSGSVNDLSPLRNLESIELSIDITGTQLTSLSGLDSLREIGDKLFVHSNARLNSLRGAPLLATVVGGVLVYDQALLTDLDGLQSITTLNPSGSVQYPFGVRVYRNKKLTSLNGLQNLRDLGNQLELSQLPLLRNLEGLPAGPITVRNITLIENEALTDISLLSTYVTDQGGCAL